MIVEKVLNNNVVVSIDPTNKKRSNSYGKWYSI